MTALRIAYVANILILIPVVWAMARGRVDAVFQGAVGDEPGLRWLVTSLWSAILAASLAGLLWPAFFAPVLLIQTFYKSMWLATFVLPAWRDGRQVPRGIATVFVILVVAYPGLFYLGTG